MIDIRFTGKGESIFDMLSNLAPKPFVFKGVRTRTIEGVLQSFKVYDPISQSRLWAMNGFEAKKAGRHINWQADQILWWNQQPIDRHGEAYQDLLDELYASCYSQCALFREALTASESNELDHTIGNTDPQFTILTKVEFLSRLTTLRELAKS